MSFILIYFFLPSLIFCWWIWNTKSKVKNVELFIIIILIFVFRNYQNFTKTTFYSTSFRFVSKNLLILLLFMCFHLSSAAGSWSQWWLFTEDESRRECNCCRGTMSDQTRNLSSFPVSSLPHLLHAENI